MPNENRTQEGQGQYTPASALAAARLDRQRRMNGNGGKAKGTVRSIDYGHLRYFGGTPCRYRKRDRLHRQRRELLDPR